MATEPYSFIEARNEAARRAAPFLYGLPSQGVPAFQQAPVAVPQVSPYGIPAMRPMPPQAAPMLPQAAPAPVAPIASPTPAAPPVAPRAAPTAAQKFRRMVQEAERAAGAPLDDIGFDLVKQRYWANEVIPSLIANKETEGRVKLRKEQFDTKAQQFFEDYAKRSAPIPGSAEAQATEPSVLGDTLHDFGVGVAGGLGQLSAGVGSLVDYGIRGARAARKAMFSPLANPAEAVRFARDVAGDIARGDISAASDKLMANYGLAPPTALGEISADFSKGISEGTQSLLSTRGRQASERLGPAFEEAESVGDVLGAIGENAAAIPGVVGQGAASLVGGLPLRAAGAVRALAAIPAYQRAFTAAAAVGLPQSAGSTAQFETELRDMTLSELLEDNPEGKQVYDILADTMAGAPQADIDKAVKEVLVNRATAVAGMANVAGDVLLAAAIPGGAENVAAGLGRGVGRGRRLLRTTAAQTAEEAGAGGIQQAGQNVATNLATGTNIPVGQGVLGQAALGGVAGGIVGGGAGLVGPGGEGAQSLRSLRRSRRQPAPAAAPEATPAAPQEQPAPEAAATPAPTPSAAPEAVQPAPVEPVESPIAAPGPGVEEDALTKLVSSATKAAKTFAATTTGKRLVGQLKEPAAVVASAARLAEKTAGAEWAKLNAVQRQDLIDGTTVELNKKAKVNNDEVAAILSGMRSAVTVAPEPQVTETPLPEGLAEGLAAADAAAEIAEQEAETAEEPPPPEVVEPVVAPVVPEVNGVPTSWVIRDKTTGQVRLETSDPTAVAALNTERYEAVPVLQHLQELNTKGTLAYQAARQEAPTPRRRGLRNAVEAPTPLRRVAEAVPVYELTPEALREREDSLRTQQAQVEEELLGDNVVAWRKAHRTANSDTATDAAVRKASADIAALEASLSEEQKARLYGRDEIQSASDFLNAVELAESVRTPQEATEEVARHLSTLGDTVGTIIDTWSRQQQIAYSAMRVLRDKIQSEGWDSLQIQRDALQQAASAYDSATDAELMLRRLIPEATPATPRRRLRRTTEATPAQAPPPETPSPNVEAPAPSAVTGADQEAQASPLESPVSEPEAEATTPTVEVAEAPLEEADEIEPPEAVVERIAGDNITEDDARDLAAAIQEARDGSPSELNTLLRTMQADGAISRANARAVRQASRVTQLPANERASSRGAIDEATAEERQVEAALLYQEANEIEGTSNDKLVHLLERTAQATTLDPAERALASRMAKLAKQLKTKLVIREDPEATVAGEYDRNTNTVHLYAASHMSTLHEMLHGITSNLLASDNPVLNIPGVRKLRKDFDALLKRLRDHVGETGTDHSDPFVAHMLKSKKGPTSNTRELLAYGMSSRKFQEYLRGIKAPAGNLWQRFKDAIATFFGRTPKQRTLLDAIMDSGAEALALVESNTQLISNVNASESVLDPRDPMMAVTPSKTNPAKDYGGVSEFQRGFELFSNSVIGLEFTDHALRRAGIELTPEQSMYIAGRNYSGHVVDMRQSDERTYIKPVSDLLARMLASGEFSAVSTAEFQADLDEFFQAYHMLMERGPSLWAETVELKEGRDIDRAQIVEDMTTGAISPQEGYAQIRALAEQYAEEGFKRWGYRTGMMGSKPSELETTLEKAAEKGYTPESLAELNNLLQGIRDRTRQHLTNAGIISEGDPWVDARNWQWYVPIKSEQEPVTSLNYGGATFRNRNVQVMQGGGQGDTLNAINELAISMAASSDAMAESILVQRAWDLVSEQPELFGAEITPYEGIPKTGYVFEKDGKEHHTNFLPNPKNGFIQHDGDTHFVVELPEGDSIGGQLARGLKGFRSISNLQSKPGLLGKGAKALGQTTNIAARLYTTWSPTWQAFTSFFRNTMEVPTVIAVELFDNPIGATPFFIKFSKETVSNVLSMRSFVPEMRAVVTGDRSALTQYAEDHPGSYPWWTLQLLEAGGSSEFQAAFNQQRATDALFAKARRAERGVLDLPASAYRWWVDFTSAFATFVEYKTRTAAFKTLVEQQKLSPSHAAALVKGSLDFNQSGEWGQNINMVHAFYRVGATDIDNFRRVFTKQTGPDAGSFDFPKLTKWAPFFAMLGAAAYMTVAAMLGDDDDGVEKIKKIDPYTLTQRMILPWGDGYIGYPIGLGLPQLLLATGTLGAAVASGHITAEQAGEAYLRVVERNLPVQSLGKRKGSGLAGALGAWFAGITTPTLVAPVSELWRNTNSFGFPIRTDFPNDKKYKSDQARNSTPEEWTEMAQWLRETTGWDVFPEELRHLSRAYGGQPASGIARWALDEKAKEDAGLEPTGVKQMLRLQVNDAQFYYSRQMYAALEELEDAQKIQNANPEKANDPRLKRRVQAYKELKSARKKYYDDINKIRENKLMSTTGKRDQRKLADGRLREAVNKAERVIEATAE